MKPHTMMVERMVHLIDNLQAVEGTSLLSRLAKCEAFIEAGSRHLVRAIGEMVDDEQRHQRLLVELLDTLNATPGPRAVRAAGGELHFTHVEALIPHLIADKKRIIDRYERAADWVASDSNASRIVAGILAGHRSHLEQLSTEPRP